jgi:ribosomal protein S5
MPRIKLTKSAIDALTKTTSEVVYWDAACPGFGVKVTPQGRKVFVVVYAREVRARSSGSTPLDPMAG